MYCAWCTESLPAAEAPRTCLHCGQPPLLDGRYRLDRVLGRGASGITWAATAPDGAVVAIKAVTLRSGLSDKERELVAREVEVLRQLHHPGVPALLDALVVRGGGGVRVQYLVLEYIDGGTLADDLGRRRYDEDGVLAVLEEVLPIFVYLHGLAPPVVHRDPKPSNLMRRSDGRLVLIDFGAVKDALSDPRLGGSTVAGTFGYMAPEQFQGDASPQTDLYGLGATAVALLTRREPRELLRDGRLAWRDAVRVSPGFHALLEDLLAADPADRPPSAAAVLDRVRALRETDRPSTHEPQSRHIVAPPRSGEAHPEPAAGTAILSAVSVFAAVAVCVGIVQSAAPPKVEHAAAPVVVCTPEPCAPVGSFALRGLKLGQTVDQARAAFPELVGVDPLTDFEVTVGLRGEARLPGPRFRVRTIVSDTLADCELDFVVHGALSRVACDVESNGSVAGRIADTLRTRHGAPQEASRDPVLPVGRWTWADASGTIDLDREMGDSARLVVVSTDHLAAVSAAKAKATAEALAEERAREEQRRAEIEALQKQTGSKPGEL